MLYSPGTNGFYHPQINTDIPGDALELSDAEYTRLKEGRAAGMSIVLDSAGKPSLVARPGKTLEQWHAELSQEIDTACEQQILAGFTSSALGAAYQYSSQFEDQLNLTGAIIRGQDMPYACRDADGVRAFVNHTADQLRQVGDDFTEFKLELMQRAYALKLQLDAALADQDAEALQAVSWAGGVA